MPKETETSKEEIPTEAFIPIEAKVVGGLPRFCDSCDEMLLFSMEHEGGRPFVLGLSTILECLGFAIERGELPKLPSFWANDVRSKFGINIPNWWCANWKFPIEYRQAALECLACRRYERDKRQGDNECD